MQCRACMTVVEKWTSWIFECSSKKAKKFTSRTYSLFSISKISTRFEFNLTTSSVHPTGQKAPKSKKKSKYFETYSHNNFTSTQEPIEEKWHSLEKQTNSRTKKIKYKWRSWRWRNKILMEDSLQRYGIIGIQLWVHERICNRIRESHGLN